MIYQVYPRSFADSNGDGLGDLVGITERLPALQALGVDAVWLSPFFVSPQNDGGYDVADYTDVDPRFGTLADFDELLTSAHELGLRVIIDLVPNHSSSEHRWFQEALAAGPGSPERERYMFRDGRGPGGELPPNNWESVFGGPMWTRVSGPDGQPEQWYLHIFDVSQPDLNWQNPWVRDQFEDILRFWLDRGVDGFRVDVAHGLIKADGLPDYTPPKEAGSMGGGAVPLEPEISDPAEFPSPPYWAQDGVHEIYRRWNRVLAEYEGDRVLCAEAWVEPLHKLARWVRPDEMHQAFNFTYLEARWSAEELRKVIDTSIDAFSSVGAPSTWVLSNHDVVRHATRLVLEKTIQGDGVGPRSGVHPDVAKGVRRARAASALMLALPGSAYIYQGEELGLPEYIDLPDAARQDPTWFRTKGERYGRDGCRVPIPWEPGTPSYGFSSSGASWLPQPDDWDEYARANQEGVDDSTLELYKRALQLRAERSLGAGRVEWLTGYDSSVVAFRNLDVTVVVNASTEDVPLPTGEVLLASGDVGADTIPADTAVWVLAD